MRTLSGILATWGALWLIAGCAQAPKATTVGPTTDELPQYKQLDPTVYAIVDIEHRTTESQVHLVPDFKEPELTPEEKAATGKGEPVYRYLPFPAPDERTNSLVAPWYGGITTLQHGHGGGDAAYGWPTSIARAGGRAGIAVETDTFGSRVAASGGRRQAVTGVGGREGLIVGSGPASRV